jgi:DUF177 domain-containing protein
VSGPAPLTTPLAGLLAEAPGTIRRESVDDVTIELDGGLRLASPIRGSIQYARTNRGILVDGDIRTSLDLECSRCLGPALVPLAIKIREEILPSIDLLTGQALDTAGEPDVVRLDDHHELDLERLLREAISLAEPIAPLCRPDCPGLCVVCGERLESGNHDHEPDDIDPRLAALKAFRVDAAAETE